ncbi:MAG: methyltransferase domain-containing protein [Fibrobacteraceae bacterium]|nr:methyltransferase domain-containing protein [Fibrobacteraceae bacterium]
MTGNSKEVESDQSSIHKDLEKLVLRYLETEYMRPIAEHTQKAFENAAEFISHWNTSIVLDSGCGTGDSTLILSQKFPESPVIGIDKSEVRLAKVSKKNAELPENVFFVRAELLDFWRLAFNAKWSIKFHALYYPNPWPKSSELRYRFHAQPIFPLFLKLSPALEMRTNWKIYAEEFAFAAKIVFSRLGINAKVKLDEFIPLKTETTFEKKFVESGHKLWKVCASF